MAAPENKAELLREMAAGRKEWEELLAQIDDQDLKIKGVEGVWSIKDILAHACAYQQYMTAMLMDQKGTNGRETAQLDAYFQTHLSLYHAEHPEIPAQLSEVKGDQVNDVFVAASRYKQPGEVRAMEARAYQDLYHWVEQYAENEMNRPFSNTGRTILQLVPDQCYNHYRIHIKSIRQWLEQRKQKGW